MALNVRVATTDDLNTINDIYNYYVKNTAITFDLDRWDAKQRLQWFEQLTSTNRYQVFVACNDEVIIGFAYNAPYKQKMAYQSSVEVTVYTAPDNQIKGVGRALYQPLITHIKQHNFHRAYALITVPNPASIKLHQRFNFKQVGLMTDVGHKLDQFHDVALLELAL